MHHGAGASSPHISILPQPSLTYNVLADMLCTTEQFSQTNVAVLDWEHRKALLLAEINAHTPDILCVQELQGNAAGAGAEDHHAWLTQHLRVQGYDGRYVRKTKRNG